MSQYAYWLSTLPDPAGGASIGDLYAGVPAVVESPSATMVIIEIWSLLERVRIYPTVTRRALLAILCVASLTLVRPFAAAPAREAHSGFNGIWNSATATPLERPAQLKDKAFFTPVEAAEWERQVAKSNQEPPPDTASNLEPADPANPGYPLVGHGSINLSVLFNVPGDKE